MDHTDMDHSDMDHSDIDHYDMDHYDMDDDMDIWAAWEVFPIRSHMKLEHVEHMLQADLLVSRSYTFQY